jgi:hypothetical protein
MGGGCSGECGVWRGTTWCTAAVLLPLPLSALCAPVVRYGLLLQRLLLWHNESLTSRTHSLHPAVRAPCRSAPDPSLLALPLLLSPPAAACCLLLAGGWLAAPTHLVLHLLRCLLLLPPLVQLLLQDGGAALLLVQALLVTCLRTRAAGQVTEGSPRVT